MQNITCSLGFCLNVSSGKFDVFGLDADQYDLLDNHEKKIS